MPRKLFRLVRSFEVPSYAVRDSTSGVYRAVSHEQPAALAVAWPDGSACFHVELYLLDVAGTYTVRGLDGGSLKVWASDLSHLVRFAYRERRHLWDIADDDMKVAIQELQRERNPLSPHRPKRNGTTIDRIVATWVRFFFWLQDHLMLDHKIVGPPEVHPQIPLSVKTYLDHRGKKRTAYKYRYVPTEATPEPVGPIGRSMRLRLWDAVTAMSDPKRVSTRYQNRFDGPADFAFHNEYIRRRRELLLTLLEATGARPGELARISVAANTNCSVTNKLTLSTLKRRKNATREIPVDRSVSIQVALFLANYRAPLLERLRKTGVECSPNDRLFLAIEGHPISEATMETEFRRIVRAAQAEEGERACMSMFRHRFITTMVRLHLQAFMDEHRGKGKHLMTDSDYRTILKRVATYTGHGSEDSLFAYIDLAWDEVGLFDYVAPARRLIDAVERGLNRLSSLKGELQGNSRLTRPQVVDHIVEALKEIQCEVKDALAASADIANKAVLH